MGSSTTMKIIKLMEEEVFPRFGYPAAIISDNDARFQAHTWEEAHKRWKVKRWLTPIYHPQANPDERRNQEIKKQLRIALQEATQHRHWDKELPNILFQLRVRRNEATQFSPAELMMGRKLPRPGDWDLINSLNSVTTNNEERRLQAVGNTRRYQSQYTTRANRSRQEHSFHVNDIVRRRNHPQSQAGTYFHAGFAPKYVGPYKIIAFPNPAVALLEMYPNRSSSDTKHIRVHVSELIPALRRL